jgi:excinuclease UvrABC nuclease subunit
MEGIFRSLQIFNLATASVVPSEPGIYIIYASNGEPYYVGRSRVNIRSRLMSHARGTGSQKVAMVLNSGLLFEYEELLSVEQMEAQLIDAFGTTRAGNLRRETDPADRY